MTGLLESHGLVAGAAFLTTTLLLWLGARWAPRLGLVADPGRHRYYAARLPTVAGVSIGLGAMLPAAATVWLTRDPIQDVIYAPADVRAILFGILLATLVLCEEAVRLDRRQGRGYTVWVSVTAMALLTGAYGVAFDELNVPWLGTFHLGLANVLLTMCWVALVVAMVELLDTIPGCSSLVVAVAAAGLWLVMAGPAEFLAPVLAAAATGAATAATPWTLGRAAVMGKTGNKVVGFLLAMLTIVGRRKMEATAFVVVPIVMLVVYAVLVFVQHFGRRLELSDPNAEPAP